MLRRPSPPDIGIVASLFKRRAKEKEEDLSSRSRESFISDDESLARANRKSAPGKKDLYYCANLASLSPLPTLKLAHMGPLGPSFDSVFVVSTIAIDSSAQSLLQLEALCYMLLDA